MIIPFSAKVVETMENSNKIVFLPDDKKNKKRRIDLGNYTHIRAYHACRPVDMGSYFAEGIKPFYVEEMRRIAATIFGIAVSTVTNNESILQSSDSNHVYFSLFKRELLGIVDTIYVGAANTLLELLRN